MGDAMLTGILRMPLPDNPANMDLVTWYQVRDRMRVAATRIDELKAENERLRVALEGYVEAHNLAYPSQLAMDTAIDEAEKIAREALKPKEPSDG